MLFFIYTSSLWTLVFGFAFASQHSTRGHTSFDAVAEIKISEPRPANTDRSASRRGRCALLGDHPEPPPGAATQRVAIHQVWRSARRMIWLHKAMRQVVGTHQCRNFSPPMVDIPAPGDRQKESHPSLRNVATRRDATSLRRLPSANLLAIDSSISLVLCHKLG